MNLPKVYMQNEIQTKLDAIVIGAGLTGLTTAHTLKKRGKRVVVIEKEQRVGGQIHTYQQGDYTFESGPNTGVVSYPEVAELFHDLAQWAVHSKKRMKRHGKDGYGRAQSSTLYLLL